MIDLENLGEWIRAKRLERGWAQNQVPGISQSMIASIESGRRNPGPKTLEQLVRIFGVPVYALNSESHSRVVSQLRKLVAQEQWWTVWQTSYQFLHRAQRHIPPAERQAIEKIMQTALEHEPGLMCVGTDFLQPDAVLEKAARMRHAKTDWAIMHQYFRAARHIVAPEALQYGKILNNGMFYAELIGNIPMALEWNTEAIQWEQDHYQLSRLPELYAARLHHLAYFGATPDFLKLQQRLTVTEAQTCTHNSFVWEDIFSGLAWHAFFAQDPDLWDRVRRQATHTYQVAWGRMPPFLELWDAAWQEQYQTGVLIAWLHNWMADSLNDWPDKGFEYMRNALFALWVLRPKAAQEWIPWLKTLAKTLGATHWLALTNYLCKSTESPASQEQDSDSKEQWLRNLAHRIQYRLAVMPLDGVQQSNEVLPKKEKNFSIRPNNVS